MSKRPFVVGIAGPSCSGKTSLARRLAGRVAGSAVVFELDWYYRDQAGASLDDIDVDVPAALDDALIAEHLARLVSVDAIDRPVYDYATHARMGGTVRVEPADVVIVEGLFALYWEAVRACFDVAFFITAGADTCLARRIDRDTHERGRSADEAARQFRARVEPMYRRYVHPTLQYADVVLPGDDPMDSLAVAAEREIAARRKSS
jgi:uridine kinase